MDPIYFLVFLSRQYFPTLPIPTPSHPISIIVRLVLQIPVLMNAFRTMLFVFLTFVLATKLQVSHLNNIGRGFQSVYRINRQITQRLQMYRVFLVHLHARTCSLQSTRLFLRNSDMNVIRMKYDSYCKPRNHYVSFP